MKLKKPFVRSIWIVLILLSFASCSNSASTTRTTPYTAITYPIGSSYPPINTDSKLSFTIEQLQELGITLIRTGSDWSNREPAKGEYKWEPLDKRINALYQDGFSILFTIPAGGPDWVCEEKTSNDTCVFSNENAFREYITALVTRYEGKIDKYQFGNEWDNLSWYPGSAEDYVHFNNIVYSVIKEISPETPVVLGGLTAAYPLYITVCEDDLQLSFDMLELKDGSNLNENIQQQICSRSDLVSRVEYVLEHADYDLVDLHLYDVSEYWPLFVDVVSKKTDKPLVVSEFGGPSSSFEQYSQTYQAERLEKYLLTLQDLPIEEAYHFNLVDNPTTYHSHSGLFTVFRQKKQAYYVIYNMLNAVE